MWAVFKNITIFDSIFEVMLGDVVFINKNDALSLANRLNAINNGTSPKFVKELDVR